MGRELLPAAPLQPCAGALSGRGHLFSGWLNLVPCNYSSNNVLLAVQACAEAPHLVGFIRSVGFYPSLASTFPAHPPSYLVTISIYWYFKH